MSAERMSVYYGTNDFSATNNKIYGRISVNAGFLKGLMQYGRRSTLSVYTENESQFNLFQNTFLQHSSGATKQAHPIYHGDVVGLHNSDLYFATDPMISAYAWSRSVLSPAAFSLCGITHSISTRSTIEEIGRLILAPIEAWDALICTSQAGKKVIEEIFRQWYDYLYRQRNLQYRSPLQLPVIPLGIHADEVADLKNKPMLRKQFRDKWQIEDDAFVVLFHGRLSFYEKAHPIPMFLAMQGFAERVGSQQKIYFVLASWFDQQEDFEHYKQAAAQFCPSVKVLFLTEVEDKMKVEMYSSADVFISLVDNIQETFGLTPIEAMANELPVIVSDWDGYKDTVRHGIDGFRIPTMLPPAGCGVDLALGYLTNAVKYRAYCGLNAQMTAIDIQSCVNALWQLFNSTELRKQMGEAGRQRVVNHYDWKQVMKQYDDLWDSMTSMRLAARPEKKYPIMSPPMIADPFLTFANYPSATLQPTHLLRLSGVAHERLNEIENNHLAHFGWQQRLPLQYLQAILDMLKDKGAQPVQRIVEFVTKLDPAVSSGIVARSLTYLLKYDVLVR